jgi:DNA-binding CsgD family transcriptional regulator
MAGVDEYDKAVEMLSDIWEKPFQARVRLAAVTLRTLVDGASKVTSGERAEVQATAQRLLDDCDFVMEALASRERPFGVEGMAWLGRARAEHHHLGWLLGLDTDEQALVKVWEDNVEAFEEFGEVYEVARSRARLAAVLAAAGEKERAATQVALAREVAQRLRATPLLKTLDGLSGPTPAPARAADLTRREVEILRLVADGRSNGEIGKQLFISTKTVSVHVSNILAKLGAAGRTEAAAIARRDDLL